MLVSDDEIRSYEDTAETEGLTLSEWVRQSLRQAERGRSHGDVDAKIAAIREATQYRFPAPSIETMLDEIERGYLESHTG